MGLGSLFGKIAGAASQALPALTGLFGTSMQVRSNNRNIDKQIAAQSRENQLTRDYNLNLAKLSNQWNIEQWNRENEYNSPAAQMARYAAAGLNPNLIYGQQNTSGQISGSLTSGASASPVDMSALGSKRGIGEVFSKLGESMMEIPLYREQVRSARLDNDLKEDKVYHSKYERYVHQMLSSINGDGESIDSLLNDPAFKNSSYSAPEVRRKLYEYRSMSYKYRSEKWEDAIKSETFEDRLQSIASQYQVDYAKAQEFMTLLEKSIAAQSNELDYRANAKTFGNLFEQFSSSGDFKRFSLDMLDLFLRTLGGLFK